VVELYTTTHDLSSKQVVVKVVILTLLFFIFLKNNFLLNLEVVAALGFLFKGVIKKNLIKKELEYIELSIKTNHTNT